MRPFLWARRCWEALPVGREQVRRPYRRFGRLTQRFGWPTRRSGRSNQRSVWGREAYPEAHLKGREWSEGPPGGLGGVGKPSLGATRCWEALAEGWDGWKAHQEVQKAHLEVREGLVGPP